MGNKAQGLNKVDGQSVFQTEQAALKKQQPSDKPPFTEPELNFLRTSFVKLDTKKVSVVEPETLRQVPFLRRHLLFERILVQIQEELQKINKKKLSFDIFVEMMAVFHMCASIEDKYKYLFKLFDVDRDFKLGIKDIVVTLDLMHNDPNRVTKRYSMEDLNMMAEKFIKQYGSGGSVKYEVFRQILKEDEVMFSLTLRFK